MRRKSSGSIAAATGLLLFAAACAGGETTTAENTPDSTASGSGAGGENECSGSVAIMAPITGPAASIGGEQLNFAKLAVDNFNNDNGSSYELVEGDTQLDPGQASTVAQQVLSNSDVLAVVGPAGSQEVQAVGKGFAAADLAFISPSATLTELTDGTYPTFFRVIPDDSVQGPTDADYVVDELRAEKAVIFEEKTSYGQGLAEAFEKALADRGITAPRIPVSQKQVDYSAVVSKVADDVDVVFATFQIAANTKVLAEQLQSAGKKAVVFASDGSFSPDFDVPGSYVSAFAPDIHNIASSADLAKQYEDEYGEFGTFGPPVYAATEVALEAMQRACDAGSLDRATVLSEVKATDQDSSILGGPIKFTQSGDVEGAKFYVFKVNEAGDMVLAE